MSLIDPIIKHCAVKHVEILKEFISFFEKKGFRERTLKHYLTIIRDFLSINDTNLTENTIFDYLKSKNTKSTYFTYLKVFADFLYKEKKLIDLETLNKIKDLSFKNKKIKRTEFIKEDRINIDIEHKWKVPKNLWEECYLQLDYEVQRMSLWLGFNFGIRSGEICNLQWKNINFKANILKIRETENGDGEKFIPKTEYSIREIKLTPNQKRTLKEYKEKVIKLELDHDYVIFQVRSKNKYKQLPTSTFRDWCKKVKIPVKFEGYTIEMRLRPHIMRYSFCSRIWEENGINGLFTLSKMLGHNDIKTTQDYLVISDEELQRDMLDLQLKAGL